jgi:hypothetical protein
MIRPILLTVYVVLIIVPLSFSCREKHADQAVYMTFDDVAYIKDFPNEFLLQDPQPAEIDEIGIRNFAIYDSIMVVGTSKEMGIWSFYSLPSSENLGSFMKNGGGPLEFTNTPSTNNQADFITEGEELVAYLYDFGTGNVKKLNITKSLLSKELYLREHNISLPPFLSNFLLVDSTNFFVKEIDNKDTQQLRYLYSKEGKTSSPVLETLNSAKLRMGSDFNILSTNTKLNRTLKRIIEAPTELNYLNLYSLDGSFAKTICIGEKLDDISEIQSRKPQWDRKYSFVNCRAFEDFFGVIHQNETFKDYQTTKRRLPSILLFDWDGKPLAKLKMENRFQYFDIDFINNHLYTFDPDSDEFLRFEIHDILETLTKDHH